MPGFGIKENTQQHGDGQGRPALPNQRPAHGGAKNRRVKRMPNQSVNAVLDKTRGCGWLGKRRQVFSQSQRPEIATDRGGHEKNRAENKNPIQFRCRATSEAQNGDGRQQQKLSDHPPAAALDKAFKHDAARAFARPPPARCGRCLRSPRVGFRGQPKIPVRPVPRAGWFRS